MTYACSAPVYDPCPSSSFPRASSSMIRQGESTELDTIDVPLQLLRYGKHWSDGHEVQLSADLILKERRPYRASMCGRFHIDYEDRYLCDLKLSTIIILVYLLHRALSSEVASMIRKRDTRLASLCNISSIAVLISCCYFKNRQSRCWSVLEARWSEVNSRRHTAASAFSRVSSTFSGLICTSRFAPAAASFLLLRCMAKILYLVTR